MNEAGKLELILSLTKRKEIHYCDKCDHSHEAEMGLLDKEDVLALLREQDFSWKLNKLLGKKDE